MATETENNGPPVETNDIKDVKELETVPDNKQLQEESGKESKKMEKSEKNEQVLTDASTAPAKTITAHKANFEKDVVYLYQLSRSPVLPSLSPYCLKVETWLRLNGIKYEVSDVQIVHV